MSADEMESHETPEQVAYGVGWADGWRGSPLQALDFTGPEREAYRDAYSRARNMATTGSPSLPESKQDPLWVRAAAWLMARWGR